VAVHSAAHEAGHLVALRLLEIPAHDALVTVEGAGHVAIAETDRSAADPRRLAIAYAAGEAATVAFGAKPKAAARAAGDDRRRIETLVGDQLEAIQAEAAALVAEHIDAIETLARSLHRVGHLGGAEVDEAVSAAFAGRPYTRLDDLDRRILQRELFEEAVVGLPSDARPGLLRFLWDRAGWSAISGAPMATLDDWRAREERAEAAPA
jgi:hypothetical protein